MIRQFETILDTDEGFNNIAKFFHKLRNKNDVIEKQYNYFHELMTDDIMFDVFVLKVINKYKSLQYRDKWLSKNIQPPEPIYFFLYDYAKKFGIHHSEFYDVHGWRFERVFDKSSLIIITKLA